MIKRRKKRVDLVSNVGKYKIGDFSLEEIINND